MNGYQGETGFMPPKGGRLDFTDEVVLAAIDFMLEPVR
jgi:cytochrome c5